MQCRIVGFIDPLCLNYDRPQSEHMLPGCGYPPFARDANHHGVVADGAQQEIVYKDNVLL